MIEALTFAEYEEKIEQEENGVLIDFWREDCGTCQSLSEELKQLEKERPELKIYSVCVDTEKDLAKKMRVMMAPSLLFVKRGSVVKKTIGFRSKDTIIETMEQLF